MAGVNRVILVGNLGKDPEVRDLESGAKVATFSLATSESYKDRNSGERITQTEWHNIVVWRGLADVAEKYLKKGSQIYLEGKLKTRSWQDKDGNNRYTTEVVADNFIMMGRSPEGAGPSNDPGPSEPPSAETQNSDAGTDIDDLPF
ncbi:single-stranded DNA-binding protein [Flexithrix dorotheae]|uniref:single-stranded DNA-binding protein n=1 Tax=Flexithrix dorotheae TaxID=70993 RepID=UPI000361BFAE|nr:single-stranded DNA-binding protein [Flexithrix dorotheae]